MVDGSQACTIVSIVSHMIRGSDCLNKSQKVEKIISQLGILDMDPTIQLVTPLPLQIGFIGT